LPVNRNKSKSLEIHGPNHEEIRKNKSSGSRNLLLYFSPLRKSIKKTKAALLAPSFLVVCSAQRRKTKTYAQNQL
jgi:hypothetical protein